MVIVLTRRCSEAVASVKQIPSQYRAMSKKRDPTGPSPFVPNILMPLKRFLELDGLSQVDRQEWAAQVFEGVVVRYIAYLETMKKTEESLRRYQKGKLSASTWFGSGGSKENESGKDEERIRMQVVIDVQSLGADASRLGIDIGSSEGFAILQSTAEA